jgi:hypothetical protein
LLNLSESVQERIGPGGEKKYAARIGGGQAPEAPRGRR